MEGKIEIEGGREVLVSLAKSQLSLAFSCASSIATIAFGSFVLQKATGWFLGYDVSLGLFAAALLVLSMGSCFKPDFLETVRKAGERGWDDRFASLAYKAMGVGLSLLFLYILHSVIN